MIQAIRDNIELILGLYSGKYKFLQEYRINEEFIYIPLKPSNNSNNTRNAYAQVQSFLDAESGIETWTISQGTKTIIGVRYYWPVECEKRYGNFQESLLGNPLPELIKYFKESDSESHTRIH